MVKLFEEDIKTKEVLGWQGLHLFHFSGSSCSQKTRIFLNLKNIDWQGHEVDLIAQKNFDPWFLGISPRGLVPALVHNGEVHIESNDICVYLDDRFPAITLIPTEKRDAIISGLREEDNLHIDIRNITMRFFIPKQLAQKKPAALKSLQDSQATIEGKTDPHKQAELKYWQAFAKQGVTNQQAKGSVNKFKGVLEDFDTRLESQAYLLGDDLTLLDIAWFIYVFRLNSAHYPLDRLHPNVAKWFNKLLAREAFAKEVTIPLPLKLISGALYLVQKAKGTTLEKLVGL